MFLVSLISSLWSSKSGPYKERFFLLRAQAVSGLILICFVYQAHAADVRCLRFVINTDRCAIGLLDGEIAKGDYQKVKDIYIKNHPALGIFYLRSNGGDVSEAIKIGQLFHKYFIIADAPVWQTTTSSFKLGASAAVICAGPDCVCASACALIWFGAPKRLGVVGLHRPHFASPTFKELSPALAAETYRPMIESVANYLTEVEAPKSAIEAMVATSSAQVTWYNLNGMPEDRAPSFAEWEDANCGAFGSDKFDMLVKQSVWCDWGNAQACALTQSLRSEEDRRFDCIGDLLFKHRSNIPAPFRTLFFAEAAPSARFFGEKDQFPSCRP